MRLIILITHLRINSTGCRLPSANDYTSRARFELYKQFLLGSQLKIISVVQQPR